jgi:CYTH domain-containing protein/CHAD domain-containing protein
VGCEIERKFLLGEPPGWLEDRSAVPIEQGYVALADDVEVRLRRAGDRRLLTVKRGSGEVREEVEVELSRAQFDALWPLTESRRLAKRRYRAALGNGLQAEIDVYEGRLEGLLVAEVEFPSEQRSREFTPPPWLGTEITGDDRYANRNLALNGKPPDPPRRRNRQGMSRSYSLKRKEGAGEGLRRIALGRAEKALEELAEARNGGGLADSIHGARKDLKKLRAVLRLSRDELDGKLFRSENSRYRDAGRLLSSSRDAEVKLQTVIALRDRFETAFPSDAGREWEGALKRERDEVAGAGEHLREPIERATRMIEEGRDRIAGWPLEKDSWRLVGPGLTRSYRSGRQALKRTLDDPGTESVHEWRKRTKDLWYQLRIVRKAWPELLEPMIDQAHDLADRLGDHHDLAVLGEDLAGRDIEQRAGFEKLIAQRQAELLDEALEIGRRLYAEKPRAFSRRVKSYWAAWRET